MRKYSLVWTLFNVHGLTSEEYVRVIAENSMLPNNFTMRDGL